MIGVAIEVSSPLIFRRWNY